MPHRFSVAITVSLSMVVAAGAASSPVTFNKDVLPILQEHCQSCHRPGQIAPMSFLTYEDARPWAKAMKVAVVTKKMPPWFADPKFGHFANDPTLQQNDIETIANWADNGAMAGDAKDAPKSVNWPRGGWEIEPDLIVKGPETAVPAHTKNDVVEWSYVTVPSGITEDTWVTSMQILPSEPPVTHHICVSFREHTPDVKYNEHVWVDRPRDESGSTLPSAVGFNSRIIPKSALSGSGGMEGCYVPGRVTQDYRIYGAGKLIKAGTDILFQLHYTPNGKAITDRPLVGFTVAKVPPQRQYVSFTTATPADPKVFAIPANDGNWESPAVERTFTEDVELVWMSPHMHLRGKDMTFRLVYPDSGTETVLSVPRYDFNWQLGYDLAKPLKVPKGTKLIVTAHFDNSINNRFNPDPNRTVYWGDMSWEEMMVPFFAVVVDRSVDPDSLTK